MTPRQIMRELVKNKASIKEFIGEILVEFGVAEGKEIVIEKEIIKVVNVDSEEKENYEKEIAKLNKTMDGIEATAKDAQELLSKEIATLKETIKTQEAKFEEWKVKAAQEKKEEEAKLEKDAPADNTQNAKTNPAKKK